MELLSREQMNQYQIAKELDTKYSTIFDRLRDLEKRNVIQEVGKAEAKKSHKPIAMYGLASLGVYSAIFQSRNKRLQRHALNICSRMFTRLWGDFSKLYGLDSKRSAVLGKWIGSDDAVKFILYNFGHSFLDRDYHILLTFRRMMDWSIVLSEWQFMSTYILATFPGKRDLVVARAGTPAKIESVNEALIELSELSYNHPKLRKVCDAIKEADSPLFTAIQEIANTDLRNANVKRDAKSTVRKRR